MGVHMRFSVIIPAYNSEKFIQRSITSILNQTFSDFEIIVINDGSKDATYEKAKSITDERLIVIDKENEGVSVARNTGIRKASGEFICFLDADDEYLPEHLAHLEKLINDNPSKSFFATRFCISMRDDINNVIVPDTTGTVVYYDDFVHETYTHSEMIWTGCICIRKEMFEKYGLFEPGVKLGEDVDMWKRVYVHTGVVYSDNVTVKRNRDGSEATKQYHRNFVADRLKRLPMFLNDDTISQKVKESLKTEYELSKLSVARSFLFIGEKKKAKEQLKEIDKSRIPKKRLYVTYICFLVPSPIIRWCLAAKNKGLYE